MTFKEVEIPADIIDEAREYRGQLLEAVAEFDESLMEKYFEDRKFFNRKRNINCIEKQLLQES